MIGIGDGQPAVDDSLRRQGPSDLRNRVSISRDHGALATVYGGDRDVIAVGADRLLGTLRRGGEREHRAIACQFLGQPPALGNEA